MQVISTAPFGRRPITADLIKQAAKQQEAPTLPSVNKWDLFRELCTAKTKLGLKDRDLAVMNALLTFHKSDDLTQDQQLIVFPSNATLASRANGMAESTLRRHLAKLISAGLIVRNDSPNGKRYALKSRGGQIAQAYGFDLRPLLNMASTIIQLAEQQRQEDADQRLLRNQIIVLKRDADKMIEYGKETGLEIPTDDPTPRLIELTKILRRKIDIPTLNQLKQTLITLVKDLKVWLGIKPVETTKMTASDSQNERHQSNSDNNNFESEDTNVPFPMVLQACPDIADFADRPLRSWHDLVSSLHSIKSMMGITAETWDHAMKIMGAKNTAIVTAGILQRMGEIRSPGGYLRKLTQKADDQAFSPMPMMLALLRRSH